MGAKPPLHLSPGQRSGQDVAPALIYKLRPPTKNARASVALGPLAPGANAAVLSPHIIDTLTSDACAACHSAHSAQAQYLLVAAAPQSGLCFTCHDGSKAVANVKAEYTSPAPPANDPATSSYYSHPATTINSHTSDQVDEFSGRLNRHAACADCHQPHRADGTLATQTTAGWTSSGAIFGASGVSVVNGPAGTAPTYTLTSTTTLEYQLCFKCHSGFTQLPAQDPAHPSRWELDKGVELNPNNASYHPVEAAGTNATITMAGSLAGDSPFKLWDFQVNSTVRCVNCHGNSRLVDKANPPAAGARLTSHAGPNLELLTANYQDRTLNARGAAYDPNDFALCYLCHAEAPMVDDSGDSRADTNFSVHGLHMIGLTGRGTGGTDIDVAGAGQGNALCAECHFRIHGSAYPVNGQTNGTRLVNFAPDVQVNGSLQWNPTTRSCTLTCHGRQHTNATY